MEDNKKRRNGLEKEQMKTIEKRLGGCKEGGISEKRK